VYAGSIPTLASTLSEAMDRASCPTIASLALGACGASRVVHPWTTIHSAATASSDGSGFLPDHRLAGAVGPLHL
jgi:hypothetical protein